MRSTDPVVVVVDRPEPARALDQLSVVGIGRIDVLVARSASRAGREVVRALDTRHDVQHVLAPPGLGGLVQYQAVTAPIAVGDLTVEPDGQRLRISDLASQM